MSELKVSKKGKSTFYKVGNYRVIFSEKKFEKNGLGRDFCNILMKNGKEEVWDFRFFYSGKSASFGDIRNIGSTKVQTRKAAQELDLMFHCIENYLSKKGVERIAGRTNHRFGVFLRKSRRFGSKKVNAVTRDVVRRINPKKSPLPSLMNPKNNFRRK